MTFTIKPNGENMQWIRRNSEKDAQKVEIAALERWTADGGSTTQDINEEAIHDARKIVSVFRKHEQNRYRITLANGCSKKDTTHYIL